jgi:hypothetical protein
MGGGNMPISTCDFDKVALNSREKTPCTPYIKDEDEFEGIIIAAPDKVAISDDLKAEDGAFARIPLCGFYAIGMGELMKDSRIVIIARDIETGDEYTGEFIDHDESPDAPLPFDVPPVDPELLKDQVSSGYFNPNLAKYANIPARPVQLEVFVSIANEHSNKVTITVTR